MARTGEFALGQVQLLLETGTVLRIADAASLGGKLIELLSNPEERRRRGEAGRLRIETERGALARTLRLVESCLDYSASRSTASSAASASATR